MRTGIGKDVAGRPKVTPPIKMIASRPSRRTVMNGSINIAYFSHHRLKRPAEARRSVLSLASSDFPSFTVHFSRSLETRSRAAPIKVMIIDATRAKVPSQIFSVPDHLSDLRP